MLETKIGDEISKGYYILFTSIMIGSEEFGAEGGGARPLPLEPTASAGCKTS